MPGYEIKRNNKKFNFVLFPSNSNTQELGKSIEYDSEKECMKAIEHFRSLVKINRIDSLNSEYVVFEEKCEMKIINKNKEIVFTTRNHYSKGNKRICNTTINSIYRNIDEGIK